ncbi:MAG: heavy metal translocating P-type ATPase, partial [Clostridia bacterium]|nr:heavy metal translocating P-type ATPase [Clostridia bacterium]
MSRKEKRMLVRIGASIVLFCLASWIPVDGWGRLLIHLLPYGVAGWDILWRSLRNIRSGQIFDENLLMSIATIGAFILGDYPEATFVMLFYQVGEWFQRYAVGKSRRSIADLMNIRPDYANLWVDGQLEEVDPQRVAPGDLILVRPGERVPLDGVVLTGESTLDTAALT